jgi:hypothetical protein
MRWSLCCAAAALVSCNLLIGLSTEPTLTDAGADGGCAHDCLGGACTAGACQPTTIATNQGGPIMVAEFGPSIFWTDFQGNTVGTASKADGGAAIFAGSTDSPLGLAANDAGVFVANAGLSGTVLRCDYTGCASQSVIFDAGFTNTDLVVNGGFVYWLQADGDEIDRLAQSGTGNVQTVATTDTNNNSHYLDRIATDGTSVYWSETFNDKILSRAIGSNNSTTIYTFPTNSGPSAIHYDNGVLYFATFGAANAQGTVSYGSLDGSGGAQPLAAAQRNPYAIATDDTYVYWTTEGDFDTNNNPAGNGGLFRCAKAGCSGNPDQLVTGLVDARGIAVDDVAIYFATFETGNGDGKIWRLAK